jgi:hypothetical protein
VNKNVIRKHGLVWALGVITFIASAMIAVGRANAAETLGFSVSPTASIDGLVTVRVLDDATKAPIADAKIVITDSANGTLEHVTDATGAFTFGGLAPGLKSVSVSRKEYASVSVLGFKTDEVTLFLGALPQGDKDAIVTGQSSGWEQIADNSLVYAGVVIRSLSAFDLVNFDMSSLISPLMDKIDVFGSHDVPSNLLAPTQKVFAGFFPITLSKPVYRLPLQTQKKTHLVHIQGKIPVKDVMSIVQGSGSPGVEIMNKLTMSRVGVSGSFTPKKDMTKDVQTTIGLAPKFQVQASAPPFAADVMLAGFTDMEGDRLVLVPTDAKLAVKAEQSANVPSVTLAGPSVKFGKSQNILTLARNVTEGRLTGIVTAKAGSKVSPGSYLKIDKIAEQSLPKSVTVEAPKNGVGGMVFEATDKNRSDSPYPVWTVYTLPSAGKSTFATDQVAKLKTGKLSNMTAVQFEFTSLDESQIDGTQVMSDIKRFARASGKLK